MGATNWEGSLKKVLTLFSTAVLTIGGVSCAGGGPSDEFCDAAVEWATLLGENLGAGETEAISYAQLETGVADINASLDEMAAATDEEAVLNDIATLKTAFEDFAETRDIAALGTGPAKEAADGVEAYAADCEGFEEAANKAGATGEDPSEGGEVDEGLEELQTVVKNAATAEESYITSNGTYSDSVEDLEGEGLDVPEGITVEITLNGNDAYCVQASDDSGSVFHFDSAVGRPEQGEC